MAFELDEEELEFLHEAVKTDDHSGTFADVAHDIFQGLLTLWVWRKEEAVVVVISSVSVHRDGYREFVINMLAGSGVINFQSEVSESLAKEASHLGCNRMVAFLKPGLAAKFGAGTEGSYLSDKHIYTVVGMEVL